MSKIKMQVGKTYRTREGKLTKCIDERKGMGYRFLCDNAKWYTEEGMWWTDGMQDSHDIIEEVDEQPEQWQPKHGSIIGCANEANNYSQTGATPKAPGDSRIQNLAKEISDDLIKRFIELGIEEKDFVEIGYHVHDYLQREAHVYLEELRAKSMHIETQMEMTRNKIDSFGLRELE